MPQRRPNEISAGGVLARPVAPGFEVCLVHAGRYWGLPKGHLEPGESAQQAALREISEECGIPQSRLRIVDTLPPSEYVYRRAGRLTFKLLHQFLVLTDGTAELAPQLSEVDEAVWLSFDEAAERASFADTRTALAAARRLLEATAR